MMKKLGMKVLKNLLLIFILFSILIVSTIFYFKSEIKDQKLNHILDQCTIALENQIKENQMDSLQLAVVLSKDKGLVDALKNDDEDLGYDILSNTMKSIQNNTNRFIRTQIITAEYTVFARSWDNIYVGMPLEDYRTDLDYFKTHKSARTSLEIGRRLGIKATVPIYDEVGLLLGFVEVISFFESITEFFSSIGIDLYVLMNQKHLDIAVLMRDNLVIDEYIVANRTYNRSHVTTLKSINFKELKSGRILFIDGKYIFYESMSNGDSQTIGGYFFVLPQKYLEYFRNPDDDISFLINVTRSSLTSVVKEEHYKADIYDKDTLASLLYFKDVVEQEDKQALLDEAYKKLDKFSKDELIQLVLEQKIIKKIDGKIK
jgi:hypothetical protein